MFRLGSVVVVALVMTLVAHAPGRSGALGARTSPSSLRIVYSSDWSGTTEIYSVDGSGRDIPVQLTSGASGTGWDATGLDFGTQPSPDGTRLAWWRQGRDIPSESLFVSSADGRGWRRLAHVNRSRFELGVSWSPDSQRLAYTGTDGVHLVRADGTGDWALHTSGGLFHWSADGRVLAFIHSNSQGALPPLDYLVVVRGKSVTTIALGALTILGWSPRGDWIAYFDRQTRGISIVSSDGRKHHQVARPASGAEFFDALAWAPDGRTIAFTTQAAGSNEVRVETADIRTGERRVRFEGSGQFEFLRDLVWSPDGRFLAFDDNTKGILVAAASGGPARLLSGDQSAEGLVWSPDSDGIAYIDQNESAYGLGATTGPLRVARLSGHVRTVVAATGIGGGDISGIAWTRPPAGLRYRRTVPRALATLSPNELVAPYPIEALAADGDRVAYSACHHTFVWTPASGTVIQTDPVASFGCDPTINQHITDIALTSDTVAYIQVEGQSSHNVWLGGMTLAPKPQWFTLDWGNDNTRYFDGWFPEIAGSGQLLVFESLGFDSVTGAISARIRRAETHGCGCPQIATATAYDKGIPLHLDVDAGRILVAGADSLLLFDTNGKQLASIPIHTTNAALSGNDIVAYDYQTLRDYDATTGTLTHAWPLPWMSDHRVGLEDIARGLAAYTLNGQIHVLRLIDGADATVATGAFAQFMNNGLVYADGTRIHLIPYVQLPLR